jgi:regulator of nucleoside diphosphate kinase
MTLPIVVTHGDFADLQDMLARHKSARQIDQPYTTSLEQELQRAQVVAAEELPKGVVTMNSKVTVYDLDEKEDEVITLVYPWQSDPANNHVSVLAPIGTALIGCHVGQTIKWPTPSGMRRLRIKSLVFQPERDGVVSVR